MKHEIKIFAPATVANVACGFDVLGFCLDSQGDEMVIRKTSEKGIKISKIEGFELPYETEQNVAGVSALAMYEAIHPDCGFDIEIYKRIKDESHQADEQPVKANGASRGHRAPSNGNGHGNHEHRAAVND